MRHVWPSTPAAASRLSARYDHRSRATSTWWSNVVRRTFRLFRTNCRRRSSPGDTLTRFRVRHVVESIVFPLVTPLRSIDSAADRSALFADFDATTSASDWSGPCIIGFGTHAFPMRASGVLVGRDLSRFPDKRLPCSPGSQTTRDRPDTREIASGHVAFRTCLFVGIPDYFHTFAAQWLACTFSLPTLHHGPHGPPCTARGWCGSLLLHHGRLALRNLLLVSPAHSRVLKNSPCPNRARIFRRDKER